MKKNNLSTPQLNLQPLKDLGFSPEDIAKIVPALSGVVSQQVEKEIVRALSLDDLKKLNQKTDGEDGVTTVEKMYYTKTGKYLTDLAIEKNQEMVDILAESIKATRQKVQKLSKLPDGQQREIINSAKQKDWTKLAKLLGSIKKP